MLWMFWLAATVMLSMSPLLVFAAGGSDDSSGSERVGLGAIGRTTLYPRRSLSSQP
jgi:hypothetical protein